MRSYAVCKRQQTICESGGQNIEKIWGLVYYDKTSVGYLKENPEGKSADVIRLVSEQSDFAEDAAYMNVG